MKIYQITIPVHYEAPLFERVCTNLVALQKFFDLARSKVGGIENSIDIDVFSPDGEHLGGMCFECDRYTGEVKIKERITSSEFLTLARKLAK